MGDLNNAWTTVGRRNSGIRFGRAWEDELESRERELIDAWDGDQHWPGIDRPLFSGPDAKRFDARLVKLDDLGYGAFGRVEKVLFDSVSLARKRIPRRRGFTIDDLRQEGLTMRKLSHPHIVRLVAIYAPRSHELCLLIWPAAVCNLGILLEDIECLRLGEGDREDILERLEALDLTNLSAFEPAPAEVLEPVNKCPLRFLRSIVGCVARAMTHCHFNNVRHLDIKPSNVLLKPGRVYLADFGVSKDVSGQDHTTINGLPGTEKWRAPELYGNYGSSMQLSDVYSLGLVYLNIATVMYNARLADFDKAVNYPPGKSREEQLQAREGQLAKHIELLTAHSLVTVPFMFTCEGQETMRPRPILSLVSRMVATCPKNRPSADKADEKLSVLGGMHQIYHAECCKKPVSWVEDRWDRKFAVLANLRMENERQLKRIEELEGKDRTYELRLENARRTHEQDVARLQSLLKDAEQRCQQFKHKQVSVRKGLTREPPRPDAASQSSARPWSGAPRFSLPEKGPTNPRPGTKVTAARPLPATVPSPTQSAGELSSSHIASVWSATSEQRRVQTQPATQGTLDSTHQHSPNSSGPTGYALRSRGSGSKLPLPVTPRRTWTPTLDRDQSLTDSSMTSSIFSRRSLETAPTPAQNSPALNGRSFTADGNHPPQWGGPAERPITTRHRRQPSNTPALIASSDSSNVILASAKTFDDTIGSSQASQGSIAHLANHKPIATLQPSKSWAEVAKSERRRLETRE